jgi:hypothetical protein
MIGRESMLNWNSENVIRIYCRLFIMKKVSGTGRNKVTGKSG